jgi:GH43 family beta-xylosidase
MMSKPRFLKLHIISAVTLLMVLTSVYIVSAATFTNPMGEGADPYVVLAGENYYLTGSYGGIYIKQASRLQDVADAKPYYVWTPPSGTDYSYEIWAPELHYLEGRWYIYFSASDEYYYNHRMYVLEGGTDPDDPLSAPFIFIGKVIVNDDHYAIDGTVLKYNNGLYFIWSGWEAEDENNGQNLYIARMENPLSTSGKRVLISKPAYEWECSESCVNEGPEAVVRKNSVSIIYSANAGNSDEYCLGQLKLAGPDPLSRNSWIKNPFPVFNKTSDVFGTGHASFVTSLDGTEDWIVYHAARYSGSGWTRDLRMQKFFWNPDNTPHLGRPASPGIASAEPVWTPVVSGKYEAEEAVRNHCTVVNEITASGGQVAGYIDYDDSYVQFTVYVDIAGEYMLNIRADNGSNSVSSHKVYVNDLFAGEVNYAPLGWKTFSNSAIMVSLNEGDNTIRFMKGANYAQVDYIEIGDRFEAENAVLRNCRVVEGKKPASNTKVAGYIDYQNSSVDFYVTIPSSGKYLLTMGNDNGCNAVSTHRISVNGSQAGDISYSKNPVWNVYSQASAIVQLNEGANIISFSKGDNYAELDYLKLAKTSVLYEVENAGPYYPKFMVQQKVAGVQAASSITDNMDSYEYTVNIDSSGTYTLDVAAGNGSTGTASYHLFVNGTYIVDLYYANLGWNKFSDACLKVSLNAGTNIITLTKGDLDAHLGYIAIR